MKFPSVLFFTLLSHSALAQPIWTVSRTETIPAPAPTEGIQQIALQIMVDETSEWAKAGELRAQVTKATNIFRQCDVELGPVEVSYVRFPQRTIDALNYSNPYKGPSDLVLTQGELSSVRPAVFLLGRQIESSARAYNRTSIHRLGQGSNVDVTPLLNVTVLSGHHCSNTPVPGANATYSTFAHELAHLLGDIDHVDEPDNLMSSRTGPNSKSGKLSASQCAKIREFALVNFSGLRSTEEDCP